MKVSDRAREDALAALDGMARIVRRERLIRGDYVSDDFDPALSGAVCQGLRYCAVGSLWAGAGIKARCYEMNDYEAWFELPGVGQYERSEFLRRRPGLRVAFAALNDAASRFIKRHPDIEPDWYYDAPVEALFETEGDQKVGRPELLRIIASAKRQLKQAA